MKKHGGISDMHSGIRKIFACAFAAVLAAGVLSGCGSTKIDGTETLLTVNGESVDLGVGSFLARYEQASMYTYWGMYFGTTGMFDTVYDESTNETYGESLKDSIIDELKLLLVIRQHADEYNVSLTDEETAAIEEAAQAYIDNNDEETREKIGASKEDVIELLNLQTIQSKMMDPIVADVDTDIPYEDIQQTTVTYVAVTASSDEDTDDVEAEEEAVSDESETSSGTSSDTASAESVEASVAALSDAQEILNLAEAESDIVDADLSAIASSVNEDYSASTGQFTTNDPTDTTLDSAIVDSVTGLEDGTLVDHVVESSDGETYYVVRLDKNNDEEASESERESEITQRKEDKYDEVTQGWVDEAEVDFNEEAWAKIALTDEDPFTLAESTAESEESAAESVASEESSEGSADSEDSDASQTDSIASTAENSEASSVVSAASSEESTVSDSSASAASSTASTS